MKKTFLVSAFFLTGTVAPAFASTMDILSLPGANRRMVIRDQGSRNYQDYLKVAFDSAQPMSMRWRALMSAADAKGKESTSDILIAANSKDWFMRNAALVALAEINPAESTKLAQKLLKDKALVVRSAAVEVLAKDVSSESRELLWKELEQEYNYKNAQSLWIRYQIVTVLAKKPQDKELKTFAKLLTDADIRVQMPAVKGLEKLTGVVLGEGKEKVSTVSLWQDYIAKGNLTEF